MKVETLQPISRPPGFSGPGLFRARFYKPALLIFAGLMIAWVGFVQSRMNRDREAMGLTRIEPLKNAPPVLAFTTVALGSFRGLIANALWIRATDLQEQDKFFEMVQLSDWITKLEPHFSTVWVHLAWNMAYNISIKFTDPPDRWRWVMDGIRLLRDEGLKYNPTEPLIYRELAWFFQHKIGANMDDAHEFYKEAWAEEMEKVIPGGKPNYPELLNPTTAEAKERVRILRENYKLDPRSMQKVDELYGPLEWRLPETHAIYWGLLGLEQCRNNPAVKNELIQLRRVIFQSMQLAFQRGRMIFFNPNSREFVYGPNLEIIARVNKAYEDMIRDDAEFRDNIANGHRNFLKTAIYFLYTNNRRPDAESWFNYLKKKYPEALLSGQEREFLREHPDAPVPVKDLDTFALDQVQEDIGETSQDRVKMIVLGLLKNSYLNLALGETQQALGYNLLAQKAYDRYQVAIGGASRKRIPLPQMDELKQDAVNEMLDPEAGLNAVYAAQLRTKLGLPAASTNAPPSRPGANSPPAAPGSTNQTASPKPKPSGAAQQ